VVVESNVLAGPALAVAMIAALAAALLAIASRGHRPAMIVVALSGVATGAAGIALILGPAVVVHAGSVLGYRLVDLRFDGLSGVFLVALGAVGTAASVYAIGYEEAGRSRLGTLSYVVFLTSLGVVFGASNAFTFLFAWEAMALSSAALVLGPRPARAVVRAGYIYIAMTHVATAAIAIALASWSAAAGSLDFAAYRAAAAGLDGPLRDVLFVLLLVGFGTKAGMMPLHVWLPRAHPVAPSHVSALMSGVMIKAGIYGLVRFGIEYMGAGPGWWGVVVLALGAASAVLGILYALSERDLKRLLAFSSIENSGIILIGLGVALLGSAAQSPALVVGGAAAALFHTVNHALFKGLLFLGAGAVQSATHSRDLDRLGGLGRVMPLTAVAFAIGSVAISGLPPLNGFASEWLTFHALLDASGTSDLDPVIRFVCYATVGALGLTAALVLAAFVKATGLTFLALPRSDAAAHAGDVPRSMRAALVLLAGSCVVVGAGAGPIGAVLAGIARAAEDPISTVVSVEELVPPPTLGSYDPLLVAAALLAAAVAVMAVARSGALPARRAPTWTCGIAPEPAFEYTATSFSKPVRLFYEPVLRPDRELRVEFHDGAPFPKRVAYRSETDHVIETRFYGPLHRASITFSQWARRAQQGTLQLYLAYTVGATVILLLVVRP
jgi:hydrogenase-4 component B